MDTQMQAAPNGSKKTGLIIAAVIIVAAVAALVWWQRSEAPQDALAPTTGGTPEATTTVADTPAAINGSLENIDIGNLEQEFQTIDNDMKAL